ncbi:hypothetical protein A6046_01070 [[Haemophilus] ducreyi]|uniref:Integrating conjugative element protein, PFL_4709 family n=1 Tax=Haemophilus ducreyi TaxID=730 RepID=A0AAC8UC85_HAEDC|nr:TIGR03757 family integrating conjugative element protein [[Haemophilus] ducreyi]AKO30845.1 hypothetical protein RY60_03635 [[Haemophilus] ducreyi]AKO32283.1 hypothetical protein RZ57_03640 [[Haemophilus] ducreyi]AKO33737.1 hypothetical protein RZ58_03655 [[Haemophilus] ducreyi]AKO35185.1 hypothetical protein RZ59_03620 [[Haemophilus] ducreyi]AKO36617.1 hypothetical protein RZ61_03660 [[Haemophilus] ducreyi]
MTVYTTQHYTIIHPELAHQLYHLDAVERWEEEISHRLSADPTQAQLQAQQIFNAPDWHSHQAQLQSAYQGLISGWQHGIKKVPAMLFQFPNSEDVVVYGETDVVKAKKQWQSWFEQQNK